MMDDGVSRLLESLRAEEKRGDLCNLTDAYVRIRVGGLLVNNILSEPRLIMQDPRFNLPPKITNRDSRVNLL